MSYSLLSLPTTVTGTMTGHQRRDCTTEKQGSGKIVPAEVRIAVSGRKMAMAPVVVACGALQTANVLELLAGNFLLTTMNLRCRPLNLEHESHQRRVVLVASREKLVRSRALSSMCSQILADPKHDKFDCDKVNVGAWKNCSLCSPSSSTGLRLGYKDGVTPER
eukprot:gnl/MRDRNA2_/MRDRNA2_72731_c1_seq3.p1 gnl/MRDRNA2_/MRDRNA2_72731_c1~~gnl/MRDRNA2_/MRDRNA2_72731_c1_seq3.p1  ORF type:complete len:164 (+),score=9.28 gnl/MRDRNA2_/MRDRNA2_72731_c1_seq3:312-803(+)